MYLNIGDVCSDKTDQLDSVVLPLRQTNTEIRCIGVRILNCINNILIVYYYVLISPQPTRAELLFFKKFPLYFIKRGTRSHPPPGTCCGVIKGSLCVYCLIVYPMTMCVNECVYFYVLVSRVTRTVHFLMKSLPFNMCGPVVIYDPASPVGGHFLTTGEASLGASSC